MEARAEQLISTIETTLKKLESDSSPLDDKTRDALSVRILKSIVKDFQLLGATQESPSITSLDAINLISGYNVSYKILLDCQIDVARSSKIIYSLVASAILLHIDDIAERIAMFEICETHLLKEFPFPKDWKASLYYFQGAFLACGLNNYIKFIGYDEYYIDMKMYLLAVLYIMRIFSPRNIYLYILSLKGNTKEIKNFKALLMSLEDHAREIVDELPSLETIFETFEKMGSTKYPGIFNVIK